jgi:hypothetical protein
MAERLKNGPNMGNDNQPPKKAQNLNMKCVVVLPFTPQNGFLSVWDLFTNSQHGHHLRAAINV